MIKYIDDIQFITVSSLDDINEIFEKYGVWSLCRRQFKYQILNLQRKLPYYIMFQALYDSSFGIPVVELERLEQLYMKYLYEYEILLDKIHCMKSIDK